MRPHLFSILLALPLTAQVAPPKDLRSFYQDKCARCHGPDGSGRSAAGEKLKGRDLTDPDWLKSTPDAKLRKVIQKGVFFGLAMPGFKAELSPEETDRLIQDVVRKAEKGKVIRPE